MSQALISVISQPRYIPACNFLHRMMVADVFVWLDSVQYTPRDWENRNKVKGPEGPQWLSVPVIQTSRDQKISDTLVDNDQNWAQKHLATLWHFYGKAPFASETLGFMEEILGKRWSRLMDLNIEIVNQACGRIGIECSFLTASSLNIDAKGEELLIGICQSIQSPYYLSGALGRNYIQENRWAQDNIRVGYHDYHHPEYPQVHGAFLPWMSFIDIIANVGFKGAWAVIASGNPTHEDYMRIFSS